MICDDNTQTCDGTIHGVYRNGDVGLDTMIKNMSRHEP